MNIHITSHSPDLFVRAYDHALRSAWAHGSCALEFSLSLPAHDDILLLPSGTHALRSETNISGYSPEEDARFSELAALLPREISIPPAFLEDADLIRETHQQDCEALVRWLIRSDSEQEQRISSELVAPLARASYAFHEALLCATDALFSAEHPSIHTQLIHEHIPALFHAREHLVTTVTRIPTLQPLAHIFLHGTTEQMSTLFAYGASLPHTQDFFTHQSMKLQEVPYALCKDCA